MADRNESLEDIRGKIATMQRNLKQLEARSDLLDGDTKQQVLDRVGSHRDDFEWIKGAYQRLEGAAEDSWHEVKEEVESRLDKAANEVQETWDRVT